MKRLLQCVPVALLFLSVSAIGSEPVEIPSAVDYFEGTIEDALERARETEQSLFVYFYIPDSAACEYMYEEFQGAFVGGFFNDRFINYKVNASDKDENGPELATRFNVGSYPTYLILDHEGKVTHRASGAMEREVLKRTISWLTGETENPMAEYDAKYEAGERDPAFIQQYLIEAKIVLPEHLSTRDLYVKAWGEAQDKYTAIAKEYLTSREPEDLINSRDFSIIKTYCKFLDDPGIRLLLDHFDAFVETTSMRQVSVTVLSVASNTAEIRALEGDETYLDVIESLEQEPLKKAADWERSILPKSGRLPENLRGELKKIFDSTKAFSSPDSE